jgi:hypothetical protein
MFIALWNTFFRQGSGAAIAAPATIGGVVQIRFLGKPREFLPIGEAFVIEIEGLQDEDGEYENALSNLFCTVEDSSETELVSPVAMSYVTGSNGTYRGTIPSSLSLTSGVAYYPVLATLTASVRDGQVFRRFTMYAKYHGQF